MKLIQSKQVNSNESVLITQSEWKSVLFNLLKEAEYREQKVLIQEVMMAGKGMLQAVAQAYVDHANLAARDPQQARILDQVRKLLAKSGAMSMGAAPTPNQKRQLNWQVVFSKVDKFLAAREHALNDMLVRNQLQKEPQIAQKIRGMLMLAQGLDNIEYELEQTDQTDKLQQIANADMKVVKTASGNDIKVSLLSWVKIGRKQGWIFD